jgi:hypothetical protein
MVYYTLVACTASWCSCFVICRVLPELQLIDWLEALKCTLDWSQYRSASMFGGASFAEQAYDIIYCIDARHGREAGSAVEMAVHTVSRGELPCYMV